MTTKEKILQYIDYKGISKRDFYRQTGLSNGFLDSGKHIGSDNIKIIISAYPEINIEWLVMDNGKMIKTKSEENATILNGGIMGGENGGVPNVQKMPPNENNPEVEWLQKDVKILEANLADIRRSEARLVQDNQDLKHNYQELKEELKTTKQELKESLHREMLLKIEVEKLKNVSDLGNTRAEVG